MPNYATLENEIANGLTGLIRRHAPVSKFSAELGWGYETDGTTIVSASNDSSQPGAIRISYDGSEGRVQAVAFPLPGANISKQTLPVNAPKIRVQCGYMDGYALPVVIGQVDAESLQSTGGVFLIEQQQQSLQGAATATFKSLRLEPSSGLTVKVTGGWYFDRYGRLRILDEQQLLIGSLPSSGNHRIDAVALDTENRTIVQVSGTATAGGVNDKSALGAAEVEDFVYDPDYVLLGLVHLYYGQTEVTESDIYRELDPRVLISTPPTNGALMGRITTKTANYTATTNDCTILCDATGGAITITLPTAASAYDSLTTTGQIFNIKKIDSSGFTVTIDGNGSELIDGATTQIISAQWTNVQLQSNGTAWYVL